MAQQTSALWKALLRDRNTVREYAFDINGVWYGAEAEVDHSVSSSLFDSFGIGNAMSATLSLSLYADEIPRGAVIKRYVRLTNGVQTSEWLPKGVFFTNRRTVEDGLWSIEAYDAMLKADITWTPKVTFPCTMEAAARDIAAAMGVELDERNVYQPYTMGAYPSGEYMRRDALRDIAAAHGGNWYISDAGKLRLVPLISFPAETSYLVTEHGDAILFGGMRILLNGSANPPVPPEPATYTIFASVEPEGSGTATGAGQYREGVSATLGAAAADGYEFVGWREDGETVSEDAAYTFVVAGDRALVAEFEAQAPAEKTILVNVSDSSLSALLRAGALTVAGESITDKTAMVISRESAVAVDFTLARAIGTARAVAVNGVDIGHVQAAGDSVSTVIPVQDGIEINIVFTPYRE